MKKCLLAAILLSAFAAQATTLTIDSGITVLSLNGKKVAEASSYELQEGTNQIVAEFAKRVSHKGKSEYLSTPPYILTFTQTNAEDKQLSLVHDNYSDISDAVDSNRAIFKIDHQSDVVQEILPTTKSFMPYSDIPQLVANYNAEKGLPFGVVEYAEQVVIESKQSLNQLKYWYQKASAAEREEFNQWLVEQNK